MLARLRLVQLRGNFLKFQVEFIDKAKNSGGIIESRVNRHARV